MKNYSLFSKLFSPCLHVLEGRLEVLNRYSQVMNKKSCIFARFQQFRQVINKADKFSTKARGFGFN